MKVNISELSKDGRFMVQSEGRKPVLAEVCGCRTCNAKKGLKFTGSTTYRAIDGGQDTTIQEASCVGRRNGTKRPCQR